MASSARHFKAPFLSKETCWAAVDQFRQRYCPQSEIPVDVLALVEFELNLEIRTITGLKEDADVDALLLGDWKTLILDQQQFLDDRFTNRLHRRQRRFAGSLRHRAAPSLCRLHPRPRPSPRHRSPARIRVFG